MKVVFSNRAYSSVLAETTEKIKTETGGLFLGAVENDTWYIIEAIDPGPKSIFEVAYFEYDQKYTQHLINKIANYYNEPLDLIGLWHRHPGSFDVFSSTDNGTNAQYAQMRPQGAISALVNIDPRFRITMYHVAQPCKYSRIHYEVGDDLIPPKYFKFKPQEKFENIMERTLIPNSRGRGDYHRSVSLKSFMDLIVPLMKDLKYEGALEYPQMDAATVKERLIDAVVDDVDFLTNDLSVEVAIAQKDKHLLVTQNAVDKVVHIAFIYLEKENKIVFKYDGVNYYYQKELFKIKHDEFLRNKRSAEPVVVIEERDSSRKVHSFLRAIGIRRNKGDN